MRKKLLIGIIVLGTICEHLTVFSQAKRLQDDLLKIAARSDSLVNKFPAEKIYIQFDKPVYVAGDTIWFKAYLFNAPSLFLSAQSGILHIDIANENNVIVRQYQFPVSDGLAWGNISLDERNFAAGNYTMRAYTNWMRNFGDEVFLYTPIKVAAASENGWLVSTKIHTAAGSPDAVTAQLQLTGIDKMPIRDSSLRVKVVDNKKTLLNQTIISNNNGLLTLDFNLSPKSVRPEIMIDDKKEVHKLLIPINTARDADIDVQFLPESGGLVAGMNTRIAFKALGPDGKGKDVSGTIVDHQGNQVAVFTSLYKGVGSFEMKPLSNETYTAKVTLPGGTKKDFTLPLVRASGTILSVRNNMESDSVAVTLTASDDLAGQNKSYFLVAKVRGLTCYAAVVNFQQSKIIRKAISKELFPTGITHFILMNTEGQPLNERLIFIDQNDALHINIQTDQLAYTAKDSVVLHISATNNDGRPVSVNLSLSVTDDAQVGLDSLNYNNILTRLWLSSDLKGYIEVPAYYFQKNKAAKLALDNLLLTQGWVNYEMPAGSVTFHAETEYTVHGKVTSALGGIVKDTRVTLFSKSPFLFKDTVTNSNGNFSFHQFPEMDKPVLLIKAVNHKGNSANVRVSMSDFQPPAFSSKIPTQMPWYADIDPAYINYLSNKIAEKKQIGYFPGGKHTLKEVIITAKKTIKGSQNLNGPGNADLVIDENEVEQAGKITWLQLLTGKIKDFRESSFTAPIQISNMGPGIPPAPYECYMIRDRMPIIIVDGELLPAWTLADARDYLMTHTAEDVRGVELISSGRFLGEYEFKFGSAPNAKWPEWCFIEITTREGNGPVLHDLPGMYLCKPMPLSWPKQFYKPRYSAQDSSNETDRRSTIDWEPNITTDPDGKATISFYAGTEPSSYTIIAEGTDLNGNIGYQRKTINIGRRKVAAKSK